MVHVPNPTVARVEALAREADAPPRSREVSRVCEDEVQAALETVANDRTAATPCREVIETGFQGADAA